MAKSGPVTSRFGCIASHRNTGLLPRGLLTSRIRVSSSTWTMSTRTTSERARLARSSILNPPISHTANASMARGIWKGTDGGSLRRRRCKVGADQMSTNDSMHVTPYLSFNGQCEAAFKFYEQCLGGQLGAIFRYAGSPMADSAPPDWQEKVMHGSVTVGGQVLMGADVTPDRYEEPKGFALSIQLSNTTEAERIFQELASGGRE